jgi:hypothetical protein
MGMSCDPMFDPATGIPGRYSLFGSDQYPYADDDRGNTYLSDEQRAAVTARCVFLRCDEAGAFACREGFRCDVANAPTTTVGCVGIPCAELGRCSNDLFICEPTSAGPRYPTVDAHGCVLRNCEEGGVCAARQHCDVTRATEGDGCVTTRCNDPGGECSPDEKCAPEMQPQPLPSGQVIAPDAYGCVPKRCDLDLLSCPSGMACDPSGTLADMHGCVPWTDPGIGGTGGTAGTAGTTGDPDAPGVCR